MRGRVLRVQWRSQLPPKILGNGRRYLQINSSAPATQSIDIPELPSSAPTVSPDANSNPDARFEILGDSFSLLSVSLSASQNLYTRKGSLAAVNGKAENAQSTLIILEPFRRSLLGIPFLYQRISSTTPITALISTKSPVTSVAAVHLDGRNDWMIAQRNALLAWTGHALSVKPKVNTQMSVAHWGNTHVSGRGLVALVGQGRVYQVQLKAGESYTIHPSHVVAYTMSRNPPQPYRFKSSILNFSVPTSSLGSLIPETKFLRTMVETSTWRAIRSFFFTLRTYARRTIWGDRLFLQFRGPSSILLQSRGARLTDVLTTRDVNEIADSPPGAVHDAVQVNLKDGDSSDSATSRTPSQGPEQRLSYASVRAGRATFETK